MATTLSFDCTSAARGRWLLAGLLFFFGISAAQYLLKLHKIETPQSAERSAIQRWMPQLRDFLAGENIWEKHNFPCPPAMALLLAPLAILPSYAAAMIWFALKAGMSVACIYVVFAMGEDEISPFPMWGKILTLLLCARTFQGDLVHGNVNIFIFFLILIALFAFTRRRDAVAGLTLGLAIACKVTPALFLPYFLWKRAWRVVATTLTGLGLFILVVPSLVSTWNGNRQHLQSWYANMAQPYLTQGDVLYSKHTNQSLPALAERMLTRSPSFTQFENGAYRALEFQNIADLNSRLVDWLVRGVMLIFAVGVMWSCRTPLWERRDWRMAAEFSVILLGMLLFSERTWKHHCVTLLLPFSVLCYLLARRWQDRGLRWILITTLTISTVLMTAASTGIFDAHNRAGKLAQAYGAYTWVFLLLTAALMILLRREKMVCFALPPGEPRKAFSMDFSGMR